MLINDGLNKWQRHRLKNLERYRRIKREYARSPEERKKRTAYMRIWRSKNRIKHNQMARESHQRNKHKHVEKRRNYHLLKKYGISSLDYEKMFVAQNGLCMICEKNKHLGRRRLHVDHCHVSGKIRGLLCSKCNGSLGWFEIYKAKIFSYLDNDLVR